MRKKQIAIITLIVFVTSCMITFGTMGKSYGESKRIEITEEEVGKMCVEAVFPTTTRGAERVEPIGPSENEAQKEAGEDIGAAEEEAANAPEMIDTQTPETPSPAAANVDYSKPLVILYHTHATESYQPVNGGNFHTLEVTASVRDVGDILADELQKQGIEVIHDTSIHDSPSYNQSYNRSLESVTALMGQYPSAIFVIDLHRDAASYTGNIGKTILVNGETAAQYSLVVGQGNPNVNALTIFANSVNAKAEEMYPGFGGKIIPKAYKFNQYISDYHLLLEVGNNENNIKEARTTAKYFAQVIAAVIKDIKPQG